MSRYQRMLAIYWWRFFQHNKIASWCTWWASHNNHCMVRKSRSGEGERRILIGFDGFVSSDLHCFYILSWHKLGNTVVHVLVLDIWSVWNNINCRLPKAKIQSINLWLKSVTSGWLCVASWNVETACKVPVRSQLESLTKEQLLRVVQDLVEERSQRSHSIVKLAD